MGVELDAVIGFSSSQTEHLTSWDSVGDTKISALVTQTPGSCAGVTQLVECNLAKVDVASSNLVSRSNTPFPLFSLSISSNPIV